MEEKKEQTFSEEEKEEKSEYNSDEEFHKFLLDNLPETNNLSLTEIESHLWRRAREKYLTLVKQQFFMSFKTETPHKCHWITINFDDKKCENVISDLPTIFKRRIISKRCFSGLDYYFTVEQRSEIINEYKGYHIHLLVSKLPKAKGHIIREFYTALKDYVGTPQHIDYKLYKGKQFWNDKLDYLKGDKDDAAKDLKTLNDGHFRRRYNIDPIYFN